MPQDEVTKLRDTLRSFFADVADTAKMGDVGEVLERISSSAFIAGMRLEEVPES